MDWKRLANIAIKAGGVTRGLVDELRKSGSASLEQAAKTAPNKMGCYKIYCDGLKYVGKAEYGLRHRFVQYYNGTTASYSSGKIIHEKRDKITVDWVVCESAEECRALEAKWIREYNPEWNVQSGWKGY